MIAGTTGSIYTVVYKDNDGRQYTANNLVPGINMISTGNLSSSKTYTLVSVTSNSGCTGTVSGSAIITVFSSCQWLGLNSNWNDVINWLNSSLPGNNNGNQFTVNNLNAGINTINSGSLSTSKTYTLVSVTNPSGCTGTVSGSAIITVFSSCQWLGLSSNWNDVTNWLSGILPSSNYSVLISASGVNPVIKDADVSLNNLTLSPGVKLTVLDSKLTIGGTLQCRYGCYYCRPWYR